ncbi:MAG TPA: hypothetical protein VMO47_05405, partial [Rhodothermales bacterium]|nr:hypothetical protein [Rhodothermales bacterium]
MIEPKLIGDFKTAGPKTPQQRRTDGRAVVPGSDELRTVELFDCVPELNHRAEIVTGENSSLHFLRFARIALDPSVPGYTPVAMTLGDDEEALFYVNRGSVRLTAGNQIYDLGRGDVLYVGLGEEVRVESATEPCDVSEYRAVKCHTKYPVQLVRHSDIEGTKLAADLGSKRPMSKRTVFKLVDQNVQACRLLF